MSDTPPLPDTGTMFEELIAFLATNAMAFLGAFHDESTERIQVDLEGARHMIDLLVALEEKTRGNRTPAEDARMAETLSGVQMAFVRIAEAVQRGQPHEATPPPPAAPARPEERPPARDKVGAPDKPRDDSEPPPPRFHKTYG